MLERLWKKILRRPSLSFWAIPAFLLWLVSWVYRLLFRARRAVAGPPLKLSVPVISIGNITVGGSGKTPLVKFLVSDLLAAGVKVGVVSSGYGRSAKDHFLAPGYKVQAMPVSRTGDEVMMLAGALPEAWFSIDQSKAAAAQRLADSGQIDVIIVDDGFQHFALARDIDLIAYDAGLERRLLKPFPYGMLREGKRSLNRADIIILTRAKFAVDLAAIKRELAGFSPQAQIHHASFVAETLIGRDRKLPVKYLEDKSVFLFAGVGNFSALSRQVAGMCVNIDHAMELSDHQVYTDSLLERIKQLAADYESDLILTTAKDEVKLGSFDFGRELYYLDLTVDLDPGEEKLLAYLRDKLALTARIT